MGAAHAHELGARGARVVVNDLGSDMHGSGASVSPAQGTVDEIRAAGGTAVANGSDVGTAEGCAMLIDAAVAEFGRIDGVLHNAGIVHFAPLTETDEATFERVLRVHLYGAFNLTSLAWPHLAEHDGRVLYVTSAVGLYGAPFQISYAAAKTGLIGLTRVAAIEGRSAGISVNTLGVAAATRMMLEQMKELPNLDRWFQTYMKRELPSAAAVWLLHPDCRSTGRIYNAFGPHMSEVLIAETQGYNKLDITPEDYRDHASEIEDRSDLFVPGGFEDFHDRMFSFVEQAGAEPLSPEARGELIPSTAPEQSR
jgi:NAD(P)-dependent dehydrogenase (short-subunit alcohol dehydrogenase family)